MEKVIGKLCPNCGERLVMRCSVCHKNRSSCRNEYCTGESELSCKSCQKIFINGNKRGNTPKT